MNALLFSVHLKHFENGTFRKRWCHDNRLCDFPSGVFLNNKTEMNDNCCVFNIFASCGQRTFDAFSK